MGWNRFCFARTKTACSIALAVLALTTLSVRGFAQGGGGGGGGTSATDNLYTTLTNGLLNLSVGVGKNVGGYMGLTTTSTNRSDPSQPILDPPAGIANSTIDPYGTRVFVRINGGFDNRYRGGWDYTFGDNPGTTFTALTTVADWLVPPTVIGNNLVAKWETFPFFFSSALLAPNDLPGGGVTSGGTGGNGGGNGGGGTGGGTGGTSTGYYINNQIEVDMTATIIHDVVRFQFDINNLSPGTTSTVGIFMVQDIDVAPSLSVQTKDGPIRIPNQPYLHNETMLVGAQVPKYWESFYTVAAPGYPTLPTIHSIRGTLRPQNSTETQPTTPTRFIYGDSARINYNRWDFQPDPTIYLDRGGSLGIVNAAVAVVWDEQAVTAGQIKTYVTFVGQSNSESDYQPNMTLSVYGPQALTFLVDKTKTPTSVSAQPGQFVISAIMRNLTDLQNTGGLDVGPVNVYLQLPAGLTLVSSGNTSNPQTISSLPAGKETAVSWTVQSDGTTSGTLTYTVTATPKFGNGKVVQRTVEVPAPATLTLKGPVAVDSAGTLLNLPRMLSIPFQTGTALPSAVLNLTPPNANDTPLFDLVRYDPTKPAFPLPYVPVNSFTPGYAYWITSNLGHDRVITIDAGNYSPLAGQTDPTPQSYTVAYPAGWNQIGNPYVYGIRFSEINIFDTDTQQLLDIGTAASSQYNWISQAVYHYNTVDPDPRNWGYELFDSLGFTMQPYDGYWIYLNKGSLQFIYNGVDTPFASVTTINPTKSVGLGAQLGRATANNWRLKLAAHGGANTDNATYIGVAPGATDTFDIYKYPKPPLVTRHASMEIVHSDWTAGNGRYAQDLRSTTPGRKTWNMLVRSNLPGENVTLAWPDIAASVPRGITLTLVDPADNSRHDLRTLSGYTVKTGTDGTRSIQIIADTTSRSSIARITAFDVIANKPAGSRAVTQSVTINYTLNQPADAQIVIRNTAGQTLRTIPVTTRAAGANTNSGSAVWDMRDQKGVVLSGGLYTVELTALGTEGQRTRQTRPFLITR